MSMIIRALVCCLLLSASAWAQKPAPGPSVPASGGTFTGAINFGGSGISTGLPTNGVYLNKANQCFNAAPAIGLSGKDGTPLLQFLSSVETGEPPSDTIGIGYSALAAWTCAASNGPEVALGANALSSVTSGDHNIAIGNQAQQLSVTGQHNTSVGIDSLVTATNPQHVLAIGEHALTFAVTPTNGVFIGESDGFYLGSTNRDTAVGFNAMQGLLANSGTGAISENVAVGYNAMVNIGLTGSENTAIGSQALSSATFDGSFNTAIGYEAGISVTTGGGGVYLGQNAGTNITTGAQGIFILGQTFAAGSAAIGTICLGNSALCGGGDTVIGHHASASMATNNSHTTVVGNFALASTTGLRNTALGFTAGQSITSGANNLILGHAVESDVALTGSNNVFIGTSNACVGSGTGASNEIDLCAGSTNVVRITGASTPATSVTTVQGGLTLPAVTTGTNADFACFAAGGVITLQASACTISSLRFKDVLGELSPEQMVADVMALHPLAFKMKTSAKPSADPNYERPQVGLTAENVAAVDPRLSIYDDDMVTPKSYRQEGVIAALVVTAQAQQREIETQRMWLIMLSLIVLALGGSQAMLWRRR